MYHQKTIRAPRRGRRHWYKGAMRTRPFGALVGSIGGLVFVLVNAGALPGSMLGRGAAVVAFVAIGWFACARRRLALSSAPASWEHRRSPYR